jgi:hypothetical protein
MQVGHLVGRMRIYNTQAGVLDTDIETDIQRQNTNSGVMQRKTGTQQI